MYAVKDMQTSMVNLRELDYQISIYVLVVFECSRMVLWPWNKMYWAATWPQCADKSSDVAWIIFQPGQNPPPHSGPCNARQKMSIPTYCHIAKHPTYCHCLIAMLPSIPTYCQRLAVSSLPIQIHVASIGSSLELCGISLQIVLVSRTKSSVSFIQICLYHNVFTQLIASSWLVIPFACTSPNVALWLRFAHSDQDFDEEKVKTTEQKSTGRIFIPS